MSLPQARAFQRFGEMSQVHMEATVLDVTLPDGAWDVAGEIFGVESLGLLVKCDMTRGMAPATTRRGNNTSWSMGRGYLTANKARMVLHIQKHVFCGHTLAKKRLSASRPVQVGERKVFLHCRG